MELLQNLARTNMISLMWVPGHYGIEGNEAADELGYDEAILPCHGLEPYSGITRKETTPTRKKMSW